MAFLPKISSTAEADEALARIAAAEREMALIQLALNESVNDLKTDAQKKSISHLAVVDAEANRLKAFAKNNRPVFGDKQSLDLAHGKIGYRKSSELVLIKKGDTWAEVVGRLEEDYKTEAVKITKAANKEVMEGWGEEKLFKYGVQVKDKETFFYTLAEEKIKDQTTAELDRGVI
jgi:hypothetical protein